VFWAASRIASTSGRWSEAVKPPAAQAPWRRKPPESAGSTRGMTIARRVLGSLLVITGAVWLGQGLDVIQGSFMTGSAFWAVVGACCVVCGLALLGWPWRRAHEQ
jgi:hypothetical protein